jgi:hypothetical protein
MMLAACGLGLPVATLAQCTPEWTALAPLQTTPTGGFGRVNAVTVFDDGNGPSLYVGGRFGVIGGFPMNNVARYTRHDFEPLGSGVTGNVGNPTDVVTSMVVFDPDGAGPIAGSLIVAGSFTHAGGQTAGRIARWDGAAWHTLGSGMEGNTVRALTTFDADGPGPGLPVLVAGGDFVTAGGVMASYVAAWNGQSWSALGNGQEPGILPLSLGVIDHDGAGSMGPTLYAGGFPFSGPNLEAFARFNGASWDLIGGLCCGGGSVPRIRAMTLYDADGPGPGAESLYAAGNFRVEGTDCRNIARWTGSAWEPVGTCMGLVHDDELYMVGSFDPDGPGPNNALLVTGGALPFVTSPPPLAAWDGTAWTSLGFVPGPPRAPNAMGSLDEDGAGPMPATLLVGVQGGPVARYACSPCYANCDDSSATPVLNINDYLCFMNQFAASDPYANCDASTIQPVLNVNDFTCFLNKYAAGCP